MNTDDAADTRIESATANASPAALERVVELDHRALYVSYETAFIVFQAYGAQQRCMEGSTETSQRLSCDASLVRMRQDADGAVLDVGRKSRTIPPSIPRRKSKRSPAGPLTSW